MLYLCIVKPIKPNNMETLNFTGTKKFRLIPIGNVSFSFTRKSRAKKSEPVYIGDIHIMCETDVNITPEQEKTLLKAMKKAKTDLLTDGSDFFTTRGNKITQIFHPLFYRIKNENEELLKTFRYSDNIPVKEL